MGGLEVRRVAVRGQNDAELVHPLRRVEVAGNVVADAVKCAGLTVEFARRFASSLPLDTPVVAQIGAEPGDFQRSLAGDAVEADAQVGEAGARDRFARREDAHRVEMHPRKAPRRNEQRQTDKMQRRRADKRQRRIGRDEQERGVAVGADKARCLFLRRLRCRDGRVGDDDVYFGGA